MLMDMCITRSRELGARRIILETQTSNLKAIAFYRAMGFELVGLDASNYHNDDIARNEVRLEMALHLD
jgi:ribosomal protein S18 acetylase RimI-like enzyme